MLSKRSGDLGGRLVILFIILCEFRGCVEIHGNSLVRDCVDELGAKIKGGLSKLGLGHAHFNIASPLHSSF